jgi:hypothetical protein
VIPEVTVLALDYATAQLGLCLGLEAPDVVEGRLWPCAPSDPECSCPEQRLWAYIDGPIESIDGPNRSRDCAQSYAFILAFDWRRCWPYLYEVLADGAPIKPWKPADASNETAVLLDVQACMMSAFAELGCDMSPLTAPGVRVNSVKLIDSRILCPEANCVGVRWRLKIEVRSLATMVPPI